MSSYQEFKTFYSSNIILFIVLLFVIVYVIINWEQIYNHNYFSGQFVKPILISGIIFLIAHMLITWDDNTIESDYPSDISKYKLGQDNINKTNYDVPPIVKPLEFNQFNQFNQPVQPVQPVQPAQAIQPFQLNQSTQQFDSKYKIANRFDNPYQKSNQLENIFKKNNFNPPNTDTKLSNQNIFISHKNSAKYGIKFN